MRKLGYWKEFSLLFPTPSFANGVVIMKGGSLSNGELYFACAHHLMHELGYEVNIKPKR